MYSCTSRASLFALVAERGRTTFTALEEAVGCLD
jgi:hypothetical protein